MSQIKISKLTPEQESKLAEYRDKWINIGLSTEPANRVEAERGINLMYEAAGLPPPNKIVWCGSPFSQGLTRAVILDKKVVASVWDSVSNSVRASVWDSVGNSVTASVTASVWDSVGNSVTASVTASVWDSVRASVWDSVMASVSNSVWASVWDSVRASVGDSVRDSVRDSVGDSVMASVWDSGYGAHDANWLAFYDYFNSIGLVEETKELTGLWLQATNAGWFLPHERICWVSERHHILERDARGRLHNLAGPALAYPDGWAIYAVNGVRVPEYIIERPLEITIEKIESEQNAEVRRVMIDRYGPDRYLIDGGAKAIATDEFGTLYRKQINDDESLVMVKVRNSTPEPDGSIKDYFIRVPPEIETAHAAVAWTFGLDKTNYAPLIET